MHLTPFATSRRDPWCRAKSGCGPIVRVLARVKVGQISGIMTHRLSGVLRLFKRGEGCE